MASKCSECRFARSATMPRCGNSGSWRSGRFSQAAYICQHPGCGQMRSTIFYGATAPRDCPKRSSARSRNIALGVYVFSPWGIQDTEDFCAKNQNFIDYCKATFPQGTFSTYVDGEPVFLIGDMEFSRTSYLAMQRVSSTSQAQSNK